MKINRMSQYFVETENSSVFNDTGIYEINVPLDSNVFENNTFICGVFNHDGKIYDLQTGRPVESDDNDQ